MDAVNAPQVDLETQIMNILRAYDYPLSVGYIADELKVEKNTVNCMLYSMGVKKQIELLKMKPPLWRIIRHVVMLN